MTQYRTMVSPLQYIFYRQNSGILQLSLPSPLKPGIKSCRRCSWNSADRWCSNYIWVTNNFVACKIAFIVYIMFDGMQTSQMIHSFDDSSLGHSVSDKWNNATFELWWKIRSWNGPVADCGAGICHCVNQRHVDTKYIIMYFLRKCHCFLYYECFEYTY